MSLSAALALPDGPARTAALAAWVQSLFPAGCEPVLVGGAAVELYTGGAYATGDLDFVGMVSPAVARTLSAAGFVRHGRHWVLEAGQVFVEFPGDALGGGELAARILVGECEVIIVSPEDALVDRLAAWKHWSSMVDGVNAWLLFRAQKTVLDRSRLGKRVADAGVEDAFRALLRLDRRARSREVGTAEIERWAQAGP
jgi:hypothetical protein